MKIGLNLLFLIPGGVGGTEIFARNLVSQLAVLDKKNNYYIYANRENASLWDGLPSNFRVVVCPFFARKRFIRIIWEQVILPFQCIYNRLELLHSVGYTCPLITHCPKITTIYDLNYYFYAEDFTVWNLLIFKILIPLVAAVSDRIIVHSQESKKELVEVLKVNPRRISVIYGGFDKKFRLNTSQFKTNQVLKKYNIHGKYILSNAVSHPHKNLRSLVLAYINLINSEPKLKVDLVMLGFAGKAQTELDFVAKKGKLDKRIHFTGWVAPEDVPYFYRGASVFVFPSLYEGFGLPLVEAMASGTPLIASNASCIPEVVEGGGLLVNATNINLLSDSIAKVIKDKAYSDKLRKKGLKRSNNFSWDKLAAETLLSYKHTIK